KKADPSNKNSTRAEESDLKSILTDSWPTFLLKRGLKASEWSKEKEEATRVASRNSQEDGREGKSSHPSYDSPRDRTIPLRSSPRHIVSPDANLTMLVHCSPQKALVH
ncbi:17002_t:CDS:2, partial [Acaulospora colombiana]